jgi:hypothetical protein
MYYYAGSQRIATRVLTCSGNSLYYLLGDHLGSTSITLEATGAVVAERRYYPYGTTRTGNGTTPTDYGFTGQRNDTYIKLIQMGDR